MEVQLDELKQSRQAFQQSVSGISKTKSQASLRIRHLDT